MKKFVISVDSSCDTTALELDNLGVYHISFNYTDGENIFVDDMKEESLKRFYEAMRKGVNYKTSQINPNDFKHYFKEIEAKEHLPIIHISLTKGLSATIDNAISVKDDLGVELAVIDSKMASVGLFILVKEALKLQEEGVSFADAVKHIKDMVLNVNTFYTTNTLTYFARGGRLSKAQALFGNMLLINPILDCDLDGHLRVVKKVRGEKAAKKAYIEMIKHMSLNPENEELYICHADNLDGALSLKEELLKEIPFKDIKIHFMGPIVGAHTGPGLLACFYKGKRRVN